MSTKKIVTGAVGATVAGVISAAAYLGSGGTPPPAALPAPAPPRTDMPDAKPAPPPHPWATLTDEQADAEVWATWTWDETLGDCIVIPATAPPRLASRLAIEADRYGVGLVDLRPGTAGRYATRGATGAELKWWDVPEEDEPAAEPEK